MRNFGFETCHFGGCTGLETSASRPVQPPKWLRPRNDPQPWNDPQIDPEMIPTPKWSPFFFLSIPKWSAGIEGMVIKHGTVDCFLFFVEMLKSCNFFLFVRNFQQKESSCRLTISLQSRSSLLPVDHFSLMQSRTAWFLVLLLCYVFKKRYFGKWW